MATLGNYASSLNASFKKLYGFYFPPLHKFPKCFLSSHRDENYHNQRDLLTNFLKYLLLLIIYNDE